MSAQIPISEIDVPSGHAHFVLEDDTPIPAIVSSLIAGIPRGGVAAILSDARSSVSVRRSAEVAPLYADLIFRGNVIIGTFSSIAVQILYLFRSSFEVSDFAEVITPKDQEVVLNSLGAGPASVQSDLVSAINRWKKLGLGPDVVRSVAVGQSNKTGLKLADLYSLYESEIASADLLDYPDVVATIADTLLSTPGVAAAISRRFPRIIVDMSSVDASAGAQMLRALVAAGSSIIAISSSRSARQQSLLDEIAPGLAMNKVKVSSWLDA